MSTGPLLFALSARAAASDLMDLSLEQLASYKITSVSKKAESLSRSAAAVYVITGEDMRRSGYTSVAEALRMVPGLQVARQNSHSWAIGARGFNTGLSNKLLVLIDGRSVYSPLFSGVFWELRDVPVEDIERIEVIRGPGASLWGANAVNGVINIITRPAADAAGLTARGGGGSEELGFGFLRGGSAIGEDAHLRLSASGFRRDDGRRRGAPRDDWWLTRLQGRGDWSPGDDDRVTFLGEIFRGALDQQRPTATIQNPGSPPVDEEGHRLGASFLTRWERRLPNDTDLAVQLWYEYTDLEFTILRELRHTLDLDVQHRFRFRDRHDVVWGGAYRFSGDDVRNRSITTLSPQSRGIHTLTGFVQDQISLLPERLDLTLGSKFEFNEFTGFEIQPSGRLAFTPDDSNTLWAAVSRAVRTPTRLEDDSDLSGVSPGANPGDPPVLTVLAGNGAVEAEDLLAIEAGYRVRPREDLSFDLAAFYNIYDHLLSFELGAPTVIDPGGPNEHVRVPLSPDNQLEGESYGFELAGWWQARPWWRIHASYSFLEIDLERDAGSSDVASVGQQRRSPQHQFFLRNSLDLPYDLAFDGILRFVDELEDTGVNSYVELDLRLGWRFCESAELAVVGQNLLHDHHAEGSGSTATRVQRGVYGQLLWRWGGGP